MNDLAQLSPPAASQPTTLVNAADVEATWAAMLSAAAR